MERNTVRKNLSTYLLGLSQNDVGLIISNPEEINKIYNSRNADR